MRRALVFAGLSALACSLVVEPGDLDAGCPPELKACAGACVSRSDPEYGCSSEDCQPCLIPQATARCNAEGACVVATCLGRYADCNDDGDREGSDGCEIDTAHDPDHCGDCGAEPCRAAHGAPACAGGSCSIARCDDGFRDCNFAARDGCETEVVSDPSHCGACNDACPEGSACLQGECVPE